MSESASLYRRITEIRDQVRDPERVSLFLDDEFAFGLPRSAVVERGLTVGMLLSPDDVAELALVDEVGRATTAAVRLLAHRPRSRNELRQRLERRGFHTDAINVALDRMSELGYVNDADFAAYWVENRSEHRPRGKRLIANELRQKGIDRDVIERALDESDVDEFSSALELARTRRERLADLAPEVRRRRLIGFLQRRGFGWEIVRRVLDRLDEDEQAASYDS